MNTPSPEPRRTTEADQPVFPWNPAHKAGTCGRCGKEMAWNVPRLGPDGGFVHKDTGQPGCDDQPTAPPCVPATEGATAAPGLRQAITDAIWTLQDKISSEDAKAFEGVLLAAITPAFAKLEAELAASRSEVERLKGTLLETLSDRDDAQDRLQPLLELVEKHTLESDSSFETQDVLESHYADRDSLRTQLSAAESALAAARKDSERLDRLLADACIVEPTNEVGAKLHIFAGPRHNGRTIGRAAIDNARRTP